MFPFASVMLTAAAAPPLVVDFTTPWTNLISQPKPAGYRYLTVEILGGGAPGLADQNDADANGISDYWFSGAGGTYARSIEIDAAAYSTFDVVVAGRIDGFVSSVTSYVRLGTGPTDYALSVQSCVNHNSLTPAVLSAFGAGAAAIVRGGAGVYESTNGAPGSARLLSGGPAAQGGSLVSIAGAGKSITGPSDNAAGNNFGGGGAKYIYAEGSEGVGGAGGQAFVRMIWRRG